MERYKFQNLNPDVLRVIQQRIQKAERDNAKTHEKNDGKMIDELVAIVKEEVDRKFK